MKFFVNHKCYIEYIHFDLFNLGIGRTNPGSKIRRWIIVTKESLIDVRNTLFWWSTYIQDFLYKRKIYWHNWLKDECCPRFECCINKVTEKEQNLLKNLVRNCMEGVSTIWVNENAK